MPDLSRREWAIVGPLCAAAIVMGVYPNLFLKPMEPAVTRIVERMEQHQPLTADTAPVAPASAFALENKTLRATADKP